MSAAAVPHGMFIVSSSPVSFKRLGINDTEEVTETRVYRAKFGKL